jgi:hypothetical protein
MIPVSLRPILTLGGGVAIGLLIGWGVVGHFSMMPSNSPVTPAPTPNQDALQPTASPTPSAAEPPVVAEVKSSPSASASPSPAPQGSGLPLGVTQAALNYNTEIYSKYPGLQPPVINTDGRHLGPEATQRITGPATMLANPGGTPLPSATPAPFPSIAPLPFPFLNKSASPAPPASN